MRIELEASIKGIQEVTKLCDNAAAGGVDSVRVPPVYVNDAFTMLKQYKINIVTCVGHDGDTVETKIAGIDKAAQGGAKEVIVVLCPYDLHDKNWETIEREIFTLFSAAQVHQMQLWINCRFHMLSRPDQAKVCSFLPEGTGLRLHSPGVEDIQMAKICDVQHICASTSSVFDWSLVDHYEEYGATQTAVDRVPPQRKTNQVFKTEKEL